MFKNIKVLKYRTISTVNRQAFDLSSFLEGEPR